MHFKFFYLLFILLLPAGVVTAQTGDSVELVCPLARGDEGRFVDALLL